MERDPSSHSLAGIEQETAAAWKDTHSNPSFVWGELRGSMSADM